ncbi:NAD(P)/FAD-dependent oxidoreductase [Candidatus Thorarchaeota archaeon]|nr:MAG: NAD(P)/FAD-dependent oxidoreductase [Candidatus Thorarchaeota archaeon]
MEYDVAIVGSGPAGIFCALELLRYRPGLRIVMIEKGKRIEQRTCPNSTQARGCKKCNPCHILAGFGGAGAFSDGKLTKSTRVGGWLDEIIGDTRLGEMISYVDSQYLEHGAPKETYGDDPDKTEAWARKAAKVGLELIPQKVRHMGREGCIEVMSQMYESINDQVEVRFDTEAKDIHVNGEAVEGLETNGGDYLTAKYVVAAPGRVGNEWLSHQASRLGLETENNFVDIGVRVEIPAPVMGDIARDLYEPKLVYYSKQFDDKVRLFCFNPGGVVTSEYYDEILTVNGQSYANKKTPNSNFALLVSTRFTAPFKHPISYGQHIARLANMLGDGVLIQRLADLKRGKRSTEERIRRSPIRPTLPSACPGDLSFALPYRHLSSIMEMLEALDRLCPGVSDMGTLLYGVEVKFYSSRLKVHKSLETQVTNLYVAGDGAGITRGLMQASVSGVLVARDILRKEGTDVGRGT